MSLRTRTGVWLDDDVEVESDRGGWITLSDREAEVAVFLYDATSGSRQASIAKLRELIAACEDQIANMEQMEATR